MNRLCLLLSALALLALSATAQAQTTYYKVAVDTSSLIGTTGSLDFQFAPGVSSQDAQVQIFHFATDGILDTTSQTSGSGFGILPGILTISNGVNGNTSYNDVFQNITYGSTLSFIAGFSGPAVTMPSGLNDGSTFGFTLYDGSGNTVLGDNPDGTAADIILNGDGSFTLSPSGVASISPSPVPEASSITSLGLLLALGLGGLAWRIHRCEAPFAE